MDQMLKHDGQQHVFLSEKDRRVCRRKFTIIELLVVISIIAILASILLPALNKAREKGYTINCISNLKQLGLGFGTYSSEFEDFYPIAKRQDDYRWHHIMLILNYLSPKMLVCTSSLQQANYCSSLYLAYSRGKYPSGINSPTDWQWQFCGYGINAPEMGGGRESNLTMLANGYPMLRQSQVKRPSHFILCGESGRNSESGNLIPTFRIRNYFAGDTIYPYHQGNTATNLLCGDGSARTITGSGSLVNCMTFWYSSAGPVKSYRLAGNMWTWNGKARSDENAKR